MYGSSGTVIAAISISGPSLRLTREDLDRLGELVREEAAGLSARLGYREGGEAA